MANVSHATLTGSQLHEPKGADTAALGTVYVSNGAGSGSWSSVGTSAFTGMIADFVTPIAPSGWLECDGTVISTTTYSALAGAMTITTSGTRTTGSAVITSIPSTTNLKVGYYIFGTGIASGTTILSVDSGTQITMSANSGSSLTGNFNVSPWLLDTGTIKLPDLTTAGRFRRSRQSGTKIGDLQADQTKAHTHTLSGTTGSESSHTHSVSGTTGAMSANSTHSHGHNAPANSSGGGITGGGAFLVNQTGTGATISSADISHTHSFSATSAAGSAHTHTFSTTTDSTGSSELRPLTIVVLTCVKT